METFRCPTCIGVLPGRPCPALRRMRPEHAPSPPRVLGEENRLASSRLPIDRWMLDRLHAHGTSRSGAAPGRVARPVHDVTARRTRLRSDAIAGRDTVRAADGPDPFAPSAPPHRPPARRRADLDIDLTTRPWRRRRSWTRFALDLYTQPVAPARERSEPAGESPPMPPGRAPSRCPNLSSSPRSASASSSASAAASAGAPGARARTGASGTTAGTASRGARSRSARARRRALPAGPRRAVGRRRRLLHAGRRRPDRRSPARTECARTAATRTRRAAASRAAGSAGGARPGVHRDAGTRGPDDSTGTKLTDVGRSSLGAAGVGDRPRIAHTQRLDPGDPDRPEAPAVR